jgi:hypothetical protein
MAGRMVFAPRRWLRLWWILLLLPAGAALAYTLPGDLDGNGSVNPADEALLMARWDAKAGDARYDAAADLDNDGKVGVTDLAILGTTFGVPGADPDTTPPDLLVSLNDIPDDENDLLVVPPDHFRITLAFKGTGSLIDTESLVITSSEPIGPHPAGENLAPLFQITPSRAVWQVPAGSNLERTSHFLAVSLRDAAGNQASRSYGFAVRDFGFGAPLGELQVVFLNFDRRSDGAQAFRSSLRLFGLSSEQNPALEQQVLDQLRVDIVARAHGMYGRNPDGTAGPDPVNILFTWFDPQTPHASLCIGGQHPSQPLALGAAPLDLDNSEREQDECVYDQHGVFPHAMNHLWGFDPLFQQIFWPLMPSRGGVAIGSDPLDAALLAPEFDPLEATPAELARRARMLDALDAFAQTIAVAAAHEVGHTLGLSAPGPAPGGLFGGTVASGAFYQHDVTAAGNLPPQNFLMNAGGTFSFAAITGRQGFPKPFFRPISWAYLTNRLVRNEQVTSLDPPPQLFSVTPNPVSYGGAQLAQIAIHGANLSNAQIVDLKGAGPVPVPVLDWTVVDDETITGRLHVLFAPPGTYTVRVTNDDQQSAQLVNGLQVLP